MTTRMVSHRFNQVWRLQPTAVAGYLRICVEVVGRLSGSGP